MAKRFVDTELWQKEWFQYLTLKQKVLVKYLFENCDADIVIFIFVVFAMSRNERVICFVEDVQKTLLHRQTSSQDCC